MLFEHKIKLLFKGYITIDKSVGTMHKKIDFARSRMCFLKSDADIKKQQNQNKQEPCLYNIKIFPFLSTR